MYLMPNSFGGNRIFAQSASSVQAGEVSRLSNEEFEPERWNWTQRADGSIENRLMFGTIVSAGKRADELDVEQTDVN